MGGLALRIFLANLQGKALIERQDVLGDLQIDASGKVMHQLRPVSVPTTKLAVEAHLKSVTVDFLETTSKKSVLKVDVEPSSFEARPGEQTLRLKAIMGATNVRLPLTASKIHTVFNRAHDNVLDDLGDFITFRATYSSSEPKTGDLPHFQHGNVEPDVFIATPGEISRISNSAAAGEHIHTRQGRVLMIFALSKSSFFWFSLIFLGNKCVFDLFLI